MICPPINQALYAEGHLAILKGNLAPDGAVAKITGLKNPVITGPARVFEDASRARWRRSSPTRSRPATSSCCAISDGKA